MTTTNKFYTCRYDRTFKEVLLKESNKDLLQKILELVLEVNIKKIDIKNIERNSGNVNLRRKNLDVLLDTDRGKINIEVNARKKDYLHSRNMAYVCDMYSHYTLVGEEYTEDVQIIQINFTYGLGLEDKELVRKYYVQDENQKKFVKNLLILEFHMDRIMNFWYSKDEKEIEKYKYLIMLDLKPEELKVLCKGDVLMEKYAMDVEIVNLDPSFRRYITEEEDRRMCYNSEISIATKKGLERGIKKGIKQSSIKTAKYLVQMGVNTIEQIAEATGLPLEEVEKLKSKRK